MKGNKSSTHSRNDKATTEEGEETKEDAPAATVYDRLYTQAVQKRTIAASQEVSDPNCTFKPNIGATNLRKTKPADESANVVDRLYVAHHLDGNSNLLEIR